MIRTAPKHKGAENLLSRLRLQLSKLKKEQVKKKKQSKKNVKKPFNHRAILNDKKQIKTKNK